MNTGTVRRRGDAWQADLPMGGKRHRRTFATRAEAEGWLRAARVAKAMGETPLTPQDAVDYREAKALLPDGVSMREAARWYAEHLGVAEGGATVEELAQAYLSDFAQTGVRAPSVRATTVVVNKFVACHGHDGVATLTARTITEWLRSCDLKPNGYNTYRARVGAMVNWGRKHGYLNTDLMIGVPTMKVDNDTPAFYTLDECRAILEGTTGAWRNYVALGMFAGLRPGEARQVATGMFRGETIFLPPAITKDRKGRHVTVTDTFRRWLVDVEGDLVADIGDGRMPRKCEALGVRFISDGLRHTFATYHFAHFKNQARTAYEMGHRSPTMLYRHYRGLVDPSDGAKFWNL